MEALFGSYKELIGQFSESTTQIRQMHIGVVDHLPLRCDFCGGNHLIMHCEAEFYARYPHLKPPAYSLPLVCDFCGGDHSNERCMIEVAYPYQPPSPFQEKKADWEIAI